MLGSHIHSTSACSLPLCCAIGSVLDRMLRRNPLAAMSLHRPSRQMSLQQLAFPASGGSAEQAQDEAEEAAEVSMEHAWHIMFAVGMLLDPRRNPRICCSMH